jgi:rod shape-determining protein MreD
MTINILKYISAFIILIFVQVLILNHIQLNGLINPYLYVLFILMLPFDTPLWLVLTSSFLIGLGVDIFSDSLGMHAAAATFAGYCRPLVMGVIKPRDGYEFSNKPTIRDMGMIWYVTYASLVVFLHHFVYFFIEIFRLSEFLSVFLRVIISTVFTMLLIILSQVLFTKPRKV